MDASRGLPCLNVVGLPDQTVKEARERIRAAVLNSQYHLPSLKVTVNLAPADIRKEGGVFDLAMALGILAASGQVDPEKLAEAVALGELALDGRVRPVSGVLPIALALRHSPRRLLLPAANAAEAAAAGVKNIAPVRTLAEAVGIINGEMEPAASAMEPFNSAAPEEPEIDFLDVRGQDFAKRALEIAVAGSHPVLLIGPPGSGKTLLAQRVPTILPPLSAEEAIAVTAVHSVAGLLPGGGLIRRRPFRSPHHTSSPAALVGGGNTPKPGEISLAHHGVLFLDEFPEFRRDALEALRQPLEDGCVQIARAKRTLSFPARFLLIAAMNPCPCGFLMDASHRCRCSAPQIERYRAKVSGPLLDRIDLHIEVPAVPLDLLRADAAGDASTDIRKRVLAARGFHAERIKSLGIDANARAQVKHLKRIAPLSAPAVALLKSAAKELALSARGYTRLLKVSRTIANLAQSDGIAENHLAEAIQLRSLDRQP